MHALGHALLALAAGMCAKGIAAPAFGMDGGSTSWPRLHALSGSIEISAYLWAFLGALAALAKLGGGTIASYLQSRMAGDIAADVRLELLDAWLRTRDTGCDIARGAGRSRQLDQGHAADATNLTKPTRPANLEPHASEPSDDAGATATTLAAMIADVRDVQLGIERGVLASLRAVLQLVPLAIVLVVLAPRVALGAAGVLLPFALLLGALRRRWKRGHRRAAAEAARLLEAADDAVRHADLWTTYGAQAKARVHVARLGQLMAKRGARLEGAAAAMTGANELLAALLLLAVLGLQKLGWVQLDSAQLLPFLVTFFLAYRPLRELAEARIAWSRAESAYASFDLPFGETDKSPNEQSDNANLRVAVWPLAALTLEGVTPLHARIEPLTARIEPGEIVVLAGRTGAGKTSLFRALLGLNPLEGRLTYDGASLANAAAGPRSRPFAWGPQDAPLVAASLAANVKLGADEADAAAVLEDLGAGYLAHELTNERLGVGGRALSGGERQWVSLARAVATRQPILLLDEPTSGLDAAAQASVLQAIARLRGKRTVLLVTHRSEPLAIADRVIRLEEAKPRSVR